MQNGILKFRQCSCISEKPGYLSVKLKTLTGSNYRRVYYFLLKFYTRFGLTNVYKIVCGIIKFCLDLELLINLVYVNVKKPGIFWFWQITQVLNKIKKIPHTNL